MSTSSKPAAPAQTHKRAHERRQPTAAAPEHAIDAQTMVQMAHWSAGISPISLALAWTDWALHLATSPGSQNRLMQQALQSSLAWSQDATRALVNTGFGRPDPQASPAPLPLDQVLAEDSRYAAAEWQGWPWRPLATANKACEAWWKSASSLRGMQNHSRHQMDFYGRQLLDMMSPGNCLLTNPQALNDALRTGGKTLAQGWQLALQDWKARQELAAGRSPEHEIGPGRGLAMTPGEVVMRNDLVELIQYTPTTPQVEAEPVLIVPSCIMKYYILDLSPHNSLVRWLVGQGHSVYIVSWRNPDQSDALLGMEDYVLEGVQAPLAHIHHATGSPIHLMGYCLGGTLAAIAAAAMGGVAQQATAPRLASLSLLAAEVDFTEPGDMGVLIDEAQVRLLEDMMAARGFLTGRQMAASFQFLHARDLVWSSQTRRWLMGQDEVPNDLMIWNADVTRLPAVMHSQYLRHCFLNNDLAEGRYLHEGEPISLRDIRVPVFAVGTVKDHVAPWRSVYKIHRLVSVDVTFALTSGGHNAGIVSEPGRPRRQYQWLQSPASSIWRTPDEWVALAPHHEGSWWPAWSGWLKAQGSGQLQPARQPPKDAELGSAPGHYVFVRYSD
jgi:polyhydroxyalkanoate synthase